MQPGSLAPILALVCLVLFGTTGPSLSASVKSQGFPATLDNASEEKLSSPITVQDQQSYISEDKSWKNLTPSSESALKLTSSTLESSMVTAPHGEKEVKEKTKVSENTKSQVYDTSADVNSMVPGENITGVTVSNTAPDGSKTPLKVNTTTQEEKGTSLANETKAVLNVTVTPLAIAQDKEVTRQPNKAPDTNQAETGVNDRIEDENTSKEDSLVPPKVNSSLPTSAAPVDSTFPKPSSSPLPVGIPKPPKEPPNVPKPSTNPTTPATTTTTTTTTRPSYELEENMKNPQKGEVSGGDQEELDLASGNLEYQNLGSGNRDPEPRPPLQGMGDSEGGHFRDDEDSHFFAYFLTIMVTAIIFYLVFHNKQRIIALIIEGRAPGSRRRRRSASRARYTKLDNNLEEAITATKGEKYDQDY